MASSTTPVPTLPTLPLTPAAFLTKYLARFADNDTFNIAEADLRAEARDLVELLNQLAPRRGAPLLLGVLDELATVSQNFLVVGQGATVANATDAASAGAGVEAGQKQFKLVRDSNGPLWAFVDAKPETTQRVRVRWLPVGDPSAQTDLFPVLVLEDHPYAAGDPVQYTFASGDTRLLQVRRALPLPGAGAMNPVPTGANDDPNYIPFANLTPPANVGLTVAQVLDALGRGLKRWPGRGPVGISEGEWWLFANGIFEAKNDFTALYQPSGTDVDWQALLFSGSWAIDQLAPAINAAANAPQPPVVAYNISGVESYRGTNLANALATTGIFGDVRLNSKVTLVKNAQLAAGTYLDGGGLITDLAGYTLFVRESSRVQDLVAQNGRIEVNGLGGTYFVGGYLPGVTLYVPADKEITLESVLLTGNTFAGGGKVKLLGTSKLPMGTTIQDNTEVIPAPGGQTYSAGSGIAISPAGVISATGAGGGTPANDSITEAMLAPGVRTKLNAPGTGGGAGSTDIDYANDVALNAATVLDDTAFGRAYVLTHPSAGFAVTLPPSTSESKGQALVLTVADGATGLYRITNGGLIDEYLFAGESYTFRSTGGGWRIRRERRAMNVVRNNATQNPQMLPDGATSHIPLFNNAIDNTFGLAFSPDGGLIMPRTANVTIVAQLGLDGVSPYDAGGAGRTGPFVQALLTISNVPNVVNQVPIASSFGSGLVQLTYSGIVQKGASIYLYCYLARTSAQTNLSCSISFMEHV